MARLTATLTVLLFLFAFSSARSPLDRLENDVNDRELPNISPESEAKPTLLLPSQKPESDPTNVVEPRPQTETKQLDIHTNAKDDEITKDLPAADMQTVDAVPLLKRPINRQFPPERPDHFRYPRRGCHHGINPAMNPQIRRGEISYGDDMILAAESKDFNTETFRGGDARDIPEPRLRFQFHRRHNHEDHHHRHEGMPRFPFRHHGINPAMNPQIHQREISYGDDMILAGESKDFNTETFRGGDARDIPEPRVRFQFHRHHHHDDNHHEGMPRIPFRHHDMSAEQRFRTPFRGEEESSAEQQIRRPFRHEQEENREEDDGFMGGFRQFLNHLY